MPSVVPLSGSIAISGIGINGAVAGLNQLDSHGPGAEVFAPPASGGPSAVPAQDSLATRIAATPQQSSCKVNATCCKPLCTVRAFHRSSSAKHSSSRSMSCELKLPMVEMRNNVADNFP